MPKGSDSPGTKNLERERVSIAKLLFETEHVLN